MLNSTVPKKLIRDLSSLMEIFDALKDPQAPLYLSKLNGKFWSYPRYKPSGKVTDKYYVDFPDP